MIAKVIFVCVEFVMVRESTVITLRNNPRRYNVIYGRKALNENVGAFKVLKRSLLTRNNAIPRTTNALGEISDFLKSNQGKTVSDFYITNNQQKYNPFQLVNQCKILKINGNDTEYKLYKLNNDYHLWIPETSRYANRHLHIKAKNDEEFKVKLDGILNNQTTRAKLDFKVNNIPFGIRNMFISGMPNHEIFLDEERLTGTYRENTYKSVGVDGDLDVFDSKLGSVDRKQIVYYAPLIAFEAYSKKDEKPLNVRDDVWTKSHEAAQFINASNECNELLESIVAQTYSGQNIDPKHTAQMTTRMKEDYINNLYGYGTFNSKSKGQTLLPYGEFPKRWQFFNDPLKGGRFWEEHAPSNQEIATIMYAPQADGSAKLRYDVDKEAFFTIIDRLKIEPKDRQYTMNYARKALGVKIAMRYLQDELAKIKLDDPVLSHEEKAFNQKKWQDLSFVKDKIFNNSGDLRDSLRKGNIGFSAYAEAVGLENIPDIKPTKGFTTKGIPDKQGFVKTASDGLGDVAENYPYFENFWGWQGREYFGRSLYKIFTEHLFNRKVPPIVADNAVVMFTETLDRTGRRLKLFNDVYDRDADLSSLVKKLGERLNRGDYATAGDIVKQQQIRFFELFQGKKDYADTAVKRLALQGEGVLFEEEVFPTYEGSYLGDNNGLMDAIGLGDNNPLTSSGGVMHHLYWQETDKMALKLLPTMIDLARFMKAHQARLLYNNYEQSQSDTSKGMNYTQKRDAMLKKVYECPEMSELDNYTKAAAHEMALKYFEKNKASLNKGADEDLRILFKHVRMEYVNLLQMTANVVAMVAYNPEVRTARP